MDKSVPAYRFGEWLVEPDLNRISRGDEEQQLEPKATDVLVYLLEHTGEVVSSGELLDQVWPGRVVEESAVHQRISKIRKALGDDSHDPQYIENIPRRGYRTKAEVRTETADADLSRLGAPTPPFPAYDGDGRVDPSENHGVPGRMSPGMLFTSHRPAAAAIAVSLLAAIFTATLFRDGPSIQVTIASVAEKRIALFIAKADVPPEQTRFIDVAYRETLMRVAQLPQASLETVEVWTKDADPQTLAIEFGLDNVVSFDYVHNDLIVQITPGATAAPHIDRFRWSPAEASDPLVIDEVVERTVLDLDTLLSDVHVERMKSWGTSDVHAYRFAYEGAQYAHHLNPDNLLQAERGYRQAIASDNKFVEAYGALGDIYVDLANLAPSTAKREEARQSMLTLIDAATQADLGDQPMEMLDRRLLRLSTSHPMELERRWRAALTENPHDAEALRRYAQLLMGGRFVDEARQYLDRAIDHADPALASHIRLMDYATLGGLTDVKEEIRLMKKIIERHPNYMLTLTGLVTDNALVGNFIEAERYLERLVQSDSDGTWAYSAQLRIAVQKGDIPSNSEALANALAHPKAQNLLRGRVYFMLGDVENGIAAWRDMEPGLVHNLQYLLQIERSFDQTVLSDPRYQALLDEFGVGRRWRAYLRERIVELADITGIQPNTRVEPAEVTLIARFGQSVDE